MREHIRARCACFLMACAGASLSSVGVSADAPERERTTGEVASAGTRESAPARTGWLVVPVSTRSLDDAARVDDSARQLVRDARAQLERAGLASADIEAATTRFEREHSVDPAAIGTNDIVRWASRSREALHFLSRGDYPSARRALLEAQAISDRAAYALNRESIRARQVLDTCLFVVRAAIETGDTAAAEAQTRGCRRLVPRIQASPYTHTPEVRALVARIDTELARESTGELVVESEPSGCIVRINGVHFGQTPLRTRELPHGEYRVQVECDETLPGRVHTLVLGADDSRIRVDTDFDRAVRARPHLALAYPAAELVEARAAEDVRDLSRVVGVPVVLVRRSPHGIEWRAFATDGRELSRVTTGPRPDEAELVALAGALGEPNATSTLASGAESAPPEASDEHAPRPPRPRLLRGARRAASITTLAIGGAGLATGAVLVGLRAPRLDDYASLASTDPGYLDEQSDIRRLGIGLDVAAFTGSIAASVGGSIAVRHARRRTAVAIPSAVVGIGLLAGSIVEITRAPICPGVPVCVDAERHLDRAAILGAFAAPAIALPVAAFLPRPADDAAPPPTASVVVGPDHASVSIHGSLR